MHRTVLRAASAVAVASALLVLPACGGAAQNPGDAGTPSQAVPAAPAKIEQMSPSEKRSALAPDFPIEVPVPKGAVADSSRQGADVYVYKITIDAPIESVAAWYREAYRVRDWAAGEPSVGGQQMRMIFQKAAAQSEVQLTGNGSQTDAVVSVGIGVPVGDTY